MRVARVVQSDVATMQLEDGVPLELVSERLGHSDTYFTANTYVVTRIERQQVAADAADKRLKAIRTGRED